MAVRIKFDNTYNVIQPTFVLATRSGHKLGTIPATNISMEDNFNSAFELEFEVDRYSNGREYHLWDKLLNFKLVWVREWDVWFEMYVTIKDDNDTVKEISCTSLGEAELSQINLYNIEINTEDDIARDDYVPTVLYNSTNPEGSLLNRIMEKAPHYSIKHVDSGIAGMQRTFTFDDTSIYDAFQDIAEELDCIFVIDSGTDDDGSIARSISVYDLEAFCPECGHRDNFMGACPKCGGTNTLPGYGEDTTVFVSTENLADEITFETDTDAVKNCFRLEAGDELMTATVRSCNPNGSQYIWYISDDSKEDMSDELVQKLNAYDTTYDYYYNENVVQPSGSLVNSYNALITKYSGYNEDLVAMPTSIVGYPALMNVYYDTIDLWLFLHDSFMPSPQLDGTTAAQQASLLGSNSLSPVAVQDLSKCSASTASSAVLSMAKTIVDSRYQVKVKSSSLSGNTWTGSFTITSYADETDTADSSVVIVTVNDDYETFTKQKIDKILSKASDDDDVADIVAIFKLSLDSFKSEIKKYCLSSLNSFSNACQSCLDILIEQGVADKQTWADQNPDLYTSLYLNYYNKMSALADEIKLRESEIAIVEGVQNLIEEENAKIQAALDMEDYLGKDLWLELLSYRREDTYSNDNYISDGLDNSELFSRALEFVEAAKKEIYKASTLQHSLSASLKNLLVMKEFKPIVDKFAVGNWIRVKVNDEVYRLRLISYSIDFERLDGLSVEFSDVKKYADGISDSEDILSQAASMATSYNAVVRQAEQGDKSKKQLAEWVTSGLALTKMKIIDNADNQNITWDEHGLLCREYLPITDDYSDKQLKIINRGLYLTDDNWLTSRAGIGDFTFYNPETGQVEEAYGVIADKLVGNLVLSKKVGIYTTDNSIVIDQNGIKISDNDGTVSRFNNDGTFSLANGNLVYKDGKLSITGDGAGIDISSNSSISGLSSRITANEDGLSAEIKRASTAEGNLSTEFTATASQIRSEITSTSDELGTRISSVEQTANRVAVEIEDETDGLVKKVSKLETTADGLSYQVSESLPDQIANAQSAAVSSAKSYTDGAIAGLDIQPTDLSMYVQKSGIISAINLAVQEGSSSATIQADKINLLGAVAGSNFSIDSSGRLTCTSANISGTITTGNATISGGTIANFRIHGGFLDNGVNCGNSGSVGMSCGGDNGGSDDYIFWAGNNFRVYKSGQVTMTQAVVYDLCAYGSIILHHYSSGSWSNFSAAVLSFNETDTNTKDWLNVGEGCSVIQLGVEGTLKSVRIPNGACIWSPATNGTRYPLMGMVTGNSGVSVIRIGNSDFESVGNLWLHGKEIHSNVGVNTSSDERLKEDIHDIVNAEDFIMALSPKKYRLKKDTSGKYHTGFLAGEVKEAMDETIGNCSIYGRYASNEDVPIDPDNPDTYFGCLGYTEIIAPHVQLTQSHQHRILNLENKIAQLENELTELRKVI